MQKSSKNFVDAICEGLRDMQEFRKRQLERRFQEVHSQAILQQTKAKRSLIELQQPNTNHKRSAFSSKQNSFINAWDSQQKAEEEQEERNAKTARPQTHVIRRKHLKPRLNEAQNLIPQLKSLLRQLESPKKKKQAQDQQNLIFQLKRDLSSRRKHTVRVADILKYQDNNWVSVPIENRERPLRSAQERLNLNPPPCRTPPVLMSQRNTYNKFEEEVVELIRKKRQQQSIRKQQTSVNVISVTITKKTPKAKERRPREKLTLIELLQ